MSKVENINPEKEPIPSSWVPRVIAGGKGGDPPDNNWLETLEIGTVFVCAYITFSYGDYFELVWKGSRFYLLHQTMGNGRVLDVYVQPNIFCNEHRTYEVLGYNLPERGGSYE